MPYHSTNDPTHRVDLRTAVLRSLPPDNGLYMPDELPTLPPAFWAGLKEKSFIEIGTAVATAFFGDEIPHADIEQIVADTLTFDAPVIELAPQDHLLELFHGPTLAFKDFGARFMARLMAWLTRGDDRPLTILVATSGDTGGAVASAFHNVPGTRVVILYPKGGVSGLQEKQLTTLGGNITALEVEGSFDDCQRLVKSAFLEPGLGERLNLTSANSINLSRLVPQSFYYIHATRQVDGPPVFVVPSGNFGNLTAGLLATRLGLPVAGFVAATNANDVVPAYLASGTYAPRPSTPTISNAMDVGAPSNFARMSALFGGSWEEMRTRIHGASYTDEQTRAAIREVFDATGEALCPHTAVGWLAARDFRATHPGATTITLATAHPSKFIDTLDAVLGPDHVEIPERLACLANREKQATAMPADWPTFHAWLESQAS
jgi:threonine synthase